MSNSIRGIFGRVMVPYNLDEELKIGLLRFRHKFCDVRLWVEQHAIPAHKFVLSAHSTFFEQMFKNEAESTSEVYLKDVSFNVLYPIIEFMYTGNAHIDNQVILEQILSFSQSINFRPFSKLWDQMAEDVPASLSTTSNNIMNNKSVFTQASTVQLPPAQTSNVRPHAVAALNHDATTTRLTNCYSVSSPLCSSVVSTTILRPSSSTQAQSNASNQSDQAVRSDQIDLLSSEDCSHFSPPPKQMHATQISSTPLVESRMMRSPQLLPMPTPPKTLRRNFRGFLPAEIIPSTPTRAAIQMHTENQLNSGALQPITELSEVSQTAEIDNNEISVIEIDETDTADNEPVLQIDERDNLPLKTRLGTAKEPKRTRGRPRKMSKNDEEKIYVSTESLCAKMPRKRGRKQ